MKLYIFNVFDERKLLGFLLPGLSMLASICLSSGCADIGELSFDPNISEATSIMLGAARRPIDESAVEVLTSRPNRSVPIALVEARGRGISGEAQDMRLAMQALKREAAKLGANGVILGYSKQEQEGEGASARRLKGEAIWYPIVIELPKIQ